LTGCAKNVKKKNWLIKIGGNQASAKVIQKKCQKSTGHGSP